MGGGGGTSFSTDVPTGGIDAGSLIAAPQSNGFGTMTPGGDIGTSSPFTMTGTLGALSAGLPGVARQFNQFSGGLGQGGLLNSNRVVTQAPSNAVGRVPSPANLFSDNMSSPNGIDHIWTQAFGPTRLQSSATAALLGHLMKGV